MKRRTWKVRKWAHEPERTTILDDVLCANCGHEADLPVAIGTRVIAQVGMGFVHDVPPPAHWAPDEIECRKCGMVFNDPGIKETESEAA